MIKKAKSTDDDQEGVTNTDVATTTNDDTAAENNIMDNFDGKGFAKYLLPYAVALIGSILATAAMFKFVLLDY